MSKTILVTGTSSGFGKDTAETLAKAGHKVFATVRGIRGKSATVANELQSNGIEVLEMDVQDNVSVDAAIKSMLQKSGDKLDVVVNNAGRMVQGISEAITIEQTQTMFDVNVLGVQRVLRATLPSLRRSKGLVINIGSILGRVTIPFLGLYGATKFAVEALTESYRNELSQLGVDVVLVQPSAYPTGLYAHLEADDKSRDAEYGAIAQIPKDFGAFIGNLFSGPDAPNPHDVSETVLKLVDTAAGHRPSRVVVGNPFGADAVNAATAPIQASMIKGIGMDGLEKLKVD